MSKIKIPGSFRKHASFHLQLEFNLRQKQVLAPQTPLWKLQENQPKSYLPALLCKWRILPMPIHSHWAAQSPSDGPGENEPFSWHWTAGRTCPMLHDRRATACVEREKGPWIHNTYDFEPWSHFSQLSWFIHFSGSVSLNKSYIHFGKLQPKEGLVVTGENVSGNSMLNNVLRDCHHLFFVCYLFFHFSGFFRKKFIPSPITHPDNIIHQCSNAWSVSNSQDNIKAECKL